MLRELIPLSLTVNIGNAFTGDEYAGGARLI
jgi:hypothetical protein